MEQTNKPRKKKWPLILLGIAIIGAIGSQIECTIEVPKCCGIYWNKTACRKNRTRRFSCK